MNGVYTALNNHTRHRHRHRHRRRRIVSVFLSVLLTAVLLSSLPVAQVFADEPEPTVENIMMPADESADASDPVSTASVQQDITTQDGISASSLPNSNPDVGILTGIVSISPKSNGKQLLDIEKSSRKEGAKLIATKTKTATGQRFQIRKSGDNTYIIRSLDTGRLITERNGEIVQTGMTVATDDSQRWVIVKNGTGYIFTNAATENKLSVAGSKTTPAKKDSIVTKAQIFNVASSSIRLDGYFILQTANGNALAMDKVSLKDGAKISLKKKTKNALGLKFLFISSSNGYHGIKNSISFKALSVKDNSTSDGARIILNAYDKMKGQRFKPVPSDDGWFFLKSASGKYVSASDTAGAKIVTTSDTAKALKLQVVSSDYSSSNPKLDSKIKKIRKKIGNTDIMKKCYRYVVNKYRFRDHANDFGGDWISRYAFEMTSRGSGHCKNFAAILCVLYRSYGYDARVVTGYVPSASRGWAVHGWVEVRMNGKTYIFDPDLQYEMGGRVSFYKRTYANAPVAYRIQKRW